MNWHRLKSWMDAASPSSPVLRSRVRVQHIITTAGSLIGTLYLALFAATGMWIAFAGMLSGIVVCVGGVVVTRRGRLQAGGTATACGAAISFFIVVAARGGIESASAAWLLLIPILGSSMVGWGLGLWLTVATIAAYAVLWGAGLLISIPEPMSPSLSYGMLVVDYTTLTAMIGGLSWAQLGAWRRLVERLDEVNEALTAEVKVRQQAEQAARAATRTRETFLATMSHEMRTPLNGILGLTDALMDAELNADLQALVETVHHSGAHLQTLLSDVLDFSRLDAGVLALDLRPVPMRVLCAELVRFWSPQASEQGLTLELRWDAAIPDRVRGDPLRLRQILNNLLSNAIKFTDAGLITVCAAQRGEALRISVTDTGPGIDAARQEGIFAPFQQSNGAVSRIGGTGMGLAVSQRLAARMGGTLSVTSELGAGATFTLELSTRDAAGCVEHPRDALSGLQILVAEDNAVNQLVVRRLLEHYGATVLIAEDGVSCVEMWSDHQPDLILMDCYMPVCDGYTATARIRAAGGRQPIVALTANTDLSDWERALGAGMDALFGKPIDKAGLITFLRGCISCSPPARPSVA